MTIVRPPAVAGTFYPLDPAALRTTVRTLLASAAPRAPAPKAMIVPHAAYQYSGAIAASAYASLAQDREAIRRVILVGPAHFVLVGGVAYPSADAFETPLGDLPVDRHAIAQIASLPGVTCLDAAHAPEHSLEVQLPFLQVALGRVAVVPVLANDTPADTVGRVLELLWGASETRIIVSSDLSHYQPYETARRLDADTAAAIEALAPGGIGEERACGAEAINGLLWLARRKRLRVERLDLGNSGDTGGSRDSVVGYGAFSFFE
ncbi:MAG: AmmeMemoRadiSam system protein B [Candidatus Omnitrophica bacterium]|nr:AmmeMemoRadiSam system protein B [Candidatus Omnitrophota bacterium]